jgi:NAD(P)-dependent dehydrogenase (short-subunit alcohol dehydrogenase family)
VTTDLFDLNGKAAIVTGGNGGIGLGIARGLAGAGADIAVVGRNEAKSKAAAAELAGRGVRAIAVVADVTDRAAPRAGARSTTSPGLRCFLASTASDFVTGAAIPVDGGYSIMA